MKHEHPVNVIFKVNCRDGEAKMVAVPATNGCDGCFFKRIKVINVSGHEVFERYCSQGNNIIAKCTPENRSDNARIIYKILKSNK